MVIVLLLIGLQTVRSQPSTINDFCITPAEAQLARQINDFRKANKLPEIQLSASLFFVAKTHVADLQMHRPDTSICNTNSWSSRGTWTPCCYQAYVPKTACMWDKPKELTPYTFRGYELSYYEEGIIQPDQLWNLWINTPQVTDKLLCKGDFSDKKWAAMGIALSDNYASLWFGQRADNQGEPEVCADESRVFTPPFLANLKEGVTEAEPVKTSRFYLIYGSFVVLADAEEALRRYKNAGFKNAQIVRGDNRIRVALDVFPTLREAMFAKEKLSASYADAWILRN